MYFLYILECLDGSLYTGITTDVARRFLEHTHKMGGHYTSARGAKQIIYTEEYPNRSLASKREAEIKKWPHKKKLRLLKDKKDIE